MLVGWLVGSLLVWLVRSLRLWRRGVGLVVGFSLKTPPTLVCLPLPRASGYRHLPPAIRLPSLLRTLCARHYISEETSTKELDK